MENRCVCCGQIIPEGRMVCPQCEANANALPTGRAATKGGASYGS